MNELLAEIFAAQMSAEIQWNGEPAYAVYDIKMVPTEITLRYLSAKKRPAQGLVFKLDGGELEVNGVKAKSIVIWQDSVLEQRVSIFVRPKSRKQLRLKVWNVWRGNVSGSEVMHAWLNNSAMRVSHRMPTHLTLNCSDGEGDPDFTDLVAELELVGAGT